MEPFFGGGAVLFRKEPIGSEVVNDIDGELTNFWDVLKSPLPFRQMQAILSCTPCSEIEFNRAGSARPGLTAAERAANFLIRNRQSRQALGKSFATLAKTRTRRGMNELPSAWLNAIEGLPEIHARLQRVVILNDDAIKVIKQQDGPRTLVYADPPYLHSTRTVTDAYEHEMSVEDHAALLYCLAKIDGRFLLSGYRSELYDDMAAGYKWSRVDWEIDNKSGSGKTKQKRTESVWRNYA